jgi:general secretion pathway protein C
VHDIVAAHLFGEAADPSKHDPANTQSATANLLLAGTLAMEDPKHGIAIISNSGRSIAYRVGDSVADGELHSVYRDHILLLRRGILESLVFPRSRLATNSDGQPVHVAEPDDPLVSRNPSAGDVFRGIASLAPGGKLRGFRIYPTGNPQRLQESGLNSGDLVVAVNGVSLEKQNFQAGREMFNSVKTSRQVTVTVDRGGVRHDFTVNSQSQADPADSADESDAADQ